MEKNYPLGNVLALLVLALLRRNSLNSPKNTQVIGFAAGGGEWLLICNRQCAPANRERSMRFLVAQVVCAELTSFAINFLGRRIYVSLIWTCYGGSRCYWRNPASRSLCGLSLGSLLYSHLHLVSSPLQSLGGRIEVRGQAEPGLLLFNFMHHDRLLPLVQRSRRSVQGAQVFAGCVGLPVMMAERKRSSAAPVAGTRSPARRPWK